MPVKIEITKNVNMLRLIEELASAGFFQTSSRQDFIQVEDTDDIVSVMKVYNNHDPLGNPEPTIDERLRAVEDMLLALSLEL